MPLRELRNPSQFENWLSEWGRQLTEPGSMVLIGSGALPWHAAQRNLELPLPENSMDVDPVTDSEQVALLGYEAMIGSEFEKQRGWHVNLMPSAVLSEMPSDWKSRALKKTTGSLKSWCPRLKISWFLNSREASLGTRLMQSGRKY
jgi:hypothetical protein